MMSRATLDKKIKQLMDDIQDLRCMVVNATRRSVAALRAHDVEAAHQIYKDDAQINEKRFKLESNCIITIATQQPIVAKDLRLLASILEVVGEMERMGDYAKGIAKACILIGEEPHIKPLVDIPIMTDLVISMLNRSVTAFVNQDAESALLIPAEDDAVDKLYDQVYRDLVKVMLNNPAALEQANHLLWVAHNLERMADRVTNICERTIYAATGVIEEINASDDESIIPV
jgi:phosphate transport system protein